MSFNYRIIAHPNNMYGLHEVYYNDEGEIWGWSVDPIDGLFESREDLEGTFRTICADVLDTPAAVIDYTEPENFEFGEVPWDDKSEADHWFEYLDDGSVRRSDGKLYCSLEEYFNEQE